MYVKLWQRMLIGAATCVGVLAVCNGIPHVEAASSSTPTATVYVDGELLRFDTPAVIKSYRTLVPMRMIFEAMGANVTFDKATNSAVASLNGTTIRLPLGNKNVTVNGKTVTLDVPAMLLNNRTMVPLRFISDTFGNTLDWNGQTCVARITTSNAPQVRVIGASTDRAIQDGQSAAAESMIVNDKVIQQVQDEVGMTYNKPVWIYVTNSDNGYQQAISTYGSSYQADLVAKNSDGVAYGSHVVIPLHKQPSATDEEMTLAHELMHVLLNQNGGNDLPSWVHEGLAWETGLDVSLKNQPPIMRKRWDGIIRDDVLHGVAAKQYQPLLGNLAGEVDALSKASYNLEYQDYLAYRNLVDTYGQDKFNAFVKSYIDEGASAFTQAYGQSIAAYDAAFQQQLINETMQTDSGVRITLNVPSGYKGTFSILPQGTNVWKRLSLAPGTDTISIYKDGRVEGASIIATSTDSDAPDQDTVYLFSVLPQAITDQGVKTDAGGLAVYDSYGQYVFSNVWLSTTSDTTKYPEGNKFLGLELVDVQTIP